MIRNYRLKSQFSCSFISQTSLKPYIDELLFQLFYTFKGSMLDLIHLLLRMVYMSMPTQFSTMSEFFANFGLTVWFSPPQTMDWRSKAFIWIILKTLGRIYDVLNLTVFLLRFPNEFIPEWTWPDPCSQTSAEFFGRARPLSASRWAWPPLYSMEFGYFWSNGRRASRCLCSESPGSYSEGLIGVGWG